MVAWDRRGRRLWTGMRSTAVTVTLTATLTAFAGAGAAHASHPCTSEYLKFQDFFQTVGLQLVKGICTATSQNDPANAQRCVESFEKGMAKALEIRDKINAANSDSTLTIGPRPLGEAVWKVGKLQAQRTWVGQQVLSDTYRVQMERTGGKAKGTVSGKVCFLDEKGTSVQTADFTVSPSGATFDRTFSGVAGLVPVVLLSMPFSPLNAHQYRIMGTKGGTPQVVLDAQQVLGGR